MENKNKSFIGIAIALVALALGAASLFLSINSLQKQKTEQGAIADKADKAFAAAIESKKASEEIAALKAEIAALKASQKQGLDTSSKNMKSAFEYYSKQVSQNRELIIANQNAIKELATRTTAPAIATQTAPAETAPKPQAQSTQTAQETTSSEESAEYTIYTIKSGDHFSKLARQFNVSIEAIEEANPKVVPTALQIGQKINIPKAK